MNYELSNIEWKLCARQLNKSFLLFHDIQVLKLNRLTETTGNPGSIDQNIKIEAYKTITDEYNDFFTREFYRIRTAFADYHIQNKPDMFVRYLRVNYMGLIRLKEVHQPNSPGNIDFKSNHFLEKHKELTNEQIKHDLLKYLVNPLISSIKEDYSTEFNTIKRKQQNQRTAKQHFTKNSINSKFKWRGPVNKLVTIFFELTNSELVEDKPILEASPGELTDFIIDNFIDSNGQDLSKDTIRTILRPGRSDKRSPMHKKYNIPS